jgi:hypothetical protein
VTGGKERPILFSAPMVCALLNGAKTQTRRVVKPQPPAECSIHYMLGNEGWLPEAERAPLRHHWEAWGGPLFDARSPKALAGSFSVRCPYGAPGDLLWVRETCRAEELSRPPQTRTATRRERQLLGRTTVIEVDGLDGFDGIRYLADNAWAKIENTVAAGEAWSALYHYRGRGKQGIGNQVPSIHMPRWASRISLRITDVRVERLNDISASDALAEGMTFPEAMQWGNAPQDAFAELWRRINGEASWDANPWVWVISFQTAPTPPTGQGTLTALGNSGITK